MAEPRERGGKEVRGAALALASALALVVFRVVDGGAFRYLAERAPELAIVADLRLTSLGLIAIAYAWSRDAVRLWTRAPDARTWRLVAAWLVGAAVLVRFVGVGKVPLPRWQDQVAFTVTGSAAEELLCRGLVLGTALALWPRGRRAIVWSAVTFALLHLQYHGFRLDGLALAQLAWTLPAGLVFATVAARTESLALVYVLHVANNAIVQLV